MRLGHGRGLLTLLAGATLVFAALVPYFHGPHTELAPPFRPSSYDEAALHAAAPTGDRGGPCTICAAHRLLNSSGFSKIAQGHAVHKDSPVPRGDLALVLPSFAAPVLGRGPPLC